MPLAQVVVELKADIANFNQNIAKATTQLGNMGKSLNLIKWDSLINLGQRAFQTGQQIYRMGREVASALNDIDRISKIAGVSTDVFQKMTYAAKMADVEAGDLSIGLKKLSMGMEDASRGTGEAGKWFDVMGISVKDVTGNLKPLDLIMGQVANKFASWEDGPRKIAIAVDLFGRSGQNLIPFLNLGSVGLKKFYEEAEKLGIVLDKSLIAKGSALEDQFKRVEAQASSMWKKIVVGAWEAGEAAVDFWQKYNEGAMAFWKGGSAGLYQHLFPGEKGLVGPKSWEESLPVKAKTPPPGVAGEAAKAISYTSSQIFGSMQEEGRWVSWWQGINKEIDHTPDLVEAVEGEIAQLTREYEALGKMALEANQKMVQAWGVPNADEILAEIDKMIVAEEKLVEAAINRMELQESSWKIMADSIAKAQKQWDAIGQDIMGTLSSNMVQLATATESWGEKFKNIGQSVLNMMMQIIVKQLLMKSLFESSEGGGTGFLGKGSGIIKIVGAIGGAISGIGGGGTMFQHGGVVNRPTRAIIGEAGPEAVIPLRDGKIPVEGGRGDTYVNNTYIQATDVDSFARLYGGVIEGIYFKGRRFNKVAMR